MSKVYITVLASLLTNIAIANSITVNLQLTDEAKKALCTDTNSSCVNAKSCSRQAFFTQKIAANKQAIDTSTGIICYKANINYGNFGTSFTIDRDKTQYLKTIAYQLDANTPFSTPPTYNSLPIGGAAHCNLQAGANVPSSVLDSNLHAFDLSKLDAGVTSLSLTISTNDMSADPTCILSADK